MEKHFKIEKSNKPHKKYMAIMEDGSVVHFGDSRYQQYQDRTPLKLYKNLDHHDEKRRALYYKRHPHNYPKYSADWFSKHFSW